MEVAKLSVMEKWEDNIKVGLEMGYGMKLCTGFNWLSVGFSDMLLCAK
jgi:hypothetical protein